MKNEALPDLKRIGLELLLRHGRPVRVSGGSMSPALPDGTAVLLEPCRTDVLRPGDVVLMSAGRACVLHRFIGARKEKVVTKADASARPDAPWPQDALLGRMTAIVSHGARKPFRPGLLQRTWYAFIGCLWLFCLRIKAAV
ncbi:MAG TPA: hypothetical protein ENN09_04250 [Planctomycetes bacterium]|nr:hypothetical protein [Planctomycetota bacterium]